MATYNDLIEEVLGHQFAPSQYRSYIEDKINQGQEYVAAQLDSRVLMRIRTITTENGTVEYSLPLDFQRLYNVALIDGTGQAIPLEAQEINQFDTEPPSSGQPTNYNIDRTVLRFYPTPDRAYSIRLRYFRLPETLANPNDIPELPPEYWDLLTSFALWHCYERENDYQAAQYHKARFDEDLDKARGELQYDADDYTQIKRVGDNRIDPLSPNIWTI